VPSGLIRGKALVPSFPSLKMAKPTASDPSPSHPPPRPRLFFALCCCALSFSSPVENEVHEDFCKISRGRPILPRLKIREIRG
jgi:hypothetical protein